MLAELQSAKAFVITVNQGNRKLKRKNKLHKYVCEIHDGSKLAFFFFLSAPVACGSSQARDQTHTATMAVTQATAMITLDP